MNIQHLKYAIEVEKMGSISQAADNLYMNQPNLSKAIKELEITLGIVIFRRSSRGVIVTPDGQQFLTKAKSILAQVEELESSYLSYNKKQNFQISVPRGSYITTAFVEFFTQFDLDENVSVNFCETNSIGAIRNISEHGFSFGIIRYKSDEEKEYLTLLKEKGLSHKPIFEFEYLVLLNENSPLAKNDIISYDDLENLTEILHGDLSLSLRQSINKYQEEKVVANDKRICVYERETQFDLLAALENAFIWVSPMLKKTLTKIGFVQKRCTLSDNLYKDVLIYPSNYNFNNYDTKFIDTIEATVTKLKKELNYI